MPPRLLASLAFVLALVTAAGTTAVAQPAPSPAVDPADADEARKLSQQATADYKLGHFAEALAGYAAAYELFRAPQFLFNLAQCHFQLEQWDRAVFFFEGYLRELPAAANRALVEDLMREARERRAEHQATAQRKLDLEKQRLDLERREAERAAAQRAPGPVIAAAPRPLYKQWWFWTGVGAVVVGAVATTVVLSSGSETVLPEGSLGTWDER